MQNNIVTKQEDVYQSSCAIFRMNGANERAMIETNGGGQTYLGHKRKMEEEENTGQESKKSLPPNGKKTKGRVKIKMEFIDNKLRRYTTFSKRKTGIMKKAYELSTLTGTQVMLLVASETGHVYTFATRKLQPMITSEAGKALIQTCLNSPDPPGGNGSTAPDQRMSATGFEETDLTYSVTEEADNKESVKNQFNSGASTPETIILGNGGNSATVANTTLSSSLPLATVPVLTTSSPTTSSPTSVPMQLQQTAGFATFLAQGNSLTPGTTVQIGAFPNQSNVQQTQNQTPAVYRLNPTVVSIPSVGHVATTTSSSTQNAMTVVPTTQQNLSVVSGNMVIPAQTVGQNSAATVMYQTNQGVVYAASTTNSLPDNVILNLGQQDQGNASQQFITIPVPVSLTPSQQQQLIQGALTCHSSEHTTEVTSKRDKRK